MKKLLFLIMVGLCSCSRPDNRESSVVINLDCGLKDTITIRYVDNLSINSSDKLWDERGCVKANGVKAISIINTKEIK